MKKLVKILICFSLCFCFFLTSGCLDNPSSTISNTTDNSGSNQFNNEVTHTTPIEVSSSTPRSEIVEDYLSAVATIYYTYTNNNTTSSIYSGSGVAVYAGGYIATNWHVISEVVVGSSGYGLQVEILLDGEYQKFNAKLLWENVNFDLAILRCDYHNIPYVKMQDRWINSDNRLKITEEVWTLGTPYDESLFGSYSSGYISSNQERVSIASQRVYESLIQHSAPISNGSSGSGLFDSAGNLVALNTLGINSSSSNSANSLFFATPIYPIQNIISQIVQLEEDNNPNTNYSFPLIGVTGYDSYMAEYYSDLGDFSDNGVYVGEISNPGTAIGKLEVGDVIIGICGKDSNLDSEDYFQIDKRNDLLYALSQYKSGDEIKVFYKRGNVSNFVNIVLG